MQVIYLLFLKLQKILTQGHLQKLIWEREEESKRNIDVKEKHLLVAFLYVPQLGIKPMTFRFMGWCSNQLSHTVELSHTGHG